MKKEATLAGDDSVREGATLRTAAQKRADKKEREKEKKKAAKAKEKKAAITDQPAEDKPQTEEEKVVEVSKDSTNGMS